MWRRVIDRGPGLLRPRGGDPRAPLGARGWFPTRDKFGPFVVLPHPAMADADSGLRLPQNVLECRGGLERRRSLRVLSCRCGEGRHRDGTSDGVAVARARRTRASDRLPSRTARRCGLEAADEQDRPERRLRSGATGPLGLVSAGGGALDRDTSAARPPDHARSARRNGARRSSTRSAAWPRPSGS